MPITGTFHINNVKVQSSPFNRSILYDGTLNGSMPCKIYLPLFGKHPPANTDYEITGTLAQKADYIFVLKPEKKRAWTPVESSFNLCQWRFDAKQKVSKYLKKEIPDPKVRAFFNALTTGDIDERILSMEFGKVGLQHILAISGFHFALVAVFLNFVLRLLLPYRTSLGLLFLGLTFYYIFLGNAPSIQRAYMAISLVVLGKLFSWRISGLNALGAGLTIELLFDPLVVTQLSFQLTFLCTLAILLFYPLLYRFFCLLLPERTYADAKQFSLFDAHGYLLCSLLRKALALNFAVHLISIPVLLLLFHKFPLLSIAYNLFFPACVSLSALMLFTALLFSFWAPFIGHAIHAINNTWTSSILNLTSNPPAYLDFSLRTNSLSFGIVIGFLAVSFAFGILFYEKERSSH